MDNMFKWFSPRAKKSQGSLPQNPLPQTPSSRSPSPQRKHIFGKRGYLPRKKLIYKLSQGSMKVPGASRWYDRKKTKTFLNELLSKEKYGTDITVKEAKKVLRNLEEGKYGQDWQERFKTERRTKWLRKGLGDLENKK